MKLRKALMVCTLAAVMITGSAVAAFAEGSLTNDITVSGSSQGYEVMADIQNSEAYKALKETSPEIADMIDQVNAGTMEMADFVSKLKEMAAALTDETAKASLEAVIAKLEAKEFVTGFVDLTASETVEKNDADMYEVTISVPSLTEEVANVQILHYSMDRTEWEIVDATDVDVDAKTLTAEFQDLSPVAVIADAAAK